MFPRQFVSKLASSFFSGGLVLAASLVVGCDSGPSPAEVTKQTAIRNEAVHQEEDKANAILKKQKGAKAPVLRSIKGGINPDAAAAPK